MGVGTCGTTTVKWTITHTETVMQVVIMTPDKITHFAIPLCGTVEEMWVEAADHIVFKSMSEAYDNGTYGAGLAVPEQ